MIQTPQPTSADTALLATLNYLRADEGDTVTLVCDNPDFNGQPNNAVDCNGSWTDWNDKRFTGDSLFAALNAAALAKAVATQTSAPKMLAAAPAPATARDGDAASSSVRRRGDLTKAQWAALRYMAGEDYVATPNGNPSITQTILADLGLCTISEVHGRPGFYAVRITDAGRDALTPSDDEILTDTVPADLLAGEIAALASQPQATGGAVEREAIARIIEPQIFADLDSGRGLSTEGAKRADAVMAKADAILAALRPAPVASGGQHSSGELRRQIELLRRASEVPVPDDDSDFTIERARRGAESWRTLARNTVAAFDALSLDAIAMQPAPSPGGAVSEADIEALRELTGIEYYAGKDAWAQALERVIAHLTSTLPAAPSIQKGDEG